VKIKIKTKIILSTFLVVAISLSVCGFFTYSYVTGILKEQSIRENTIKLEQVTQQLARMQEQVKKAAVYIISDEEIGKLAKSNFAGNRELEYDVKWELCEKLKRFVAINDYICNVLIIRNDGNIFSNNVSFESYYKEKITEPWFLDFESKEQKVGFTEVHTMYLLNNRPNERVISYITKYKAFDDSSNNRYVLVLDIEYSHINKICGKNGNDFEKIVLMNGDNGIIYSSNVEDSLENMSIVKETIAQSKGYAEDKENLVISNLSAGSGWKLASIIPKDKLYSKIRWIFVYFIFIVFLSLLFVLMIMIPIILNITRPLSSLVEAMKKVSRGNLDTCISIKSGDELETIGEGFNIMVGELNEYMKASINNEKMKRRMQIDLLMSQINPHFIYNTLNSVIYLTHAQRNEDAIKITESIISILQDTVKTGEDALFATVREELNIIENYLNIQTYRYPGMFEVELKADDGLLDVKIPKMAIQPIVENALFHGIYPSERHGLLKIDISAHNGKLVVSIEDNGVGMEEETAKNIFTAPKLNKTNNHTRSIGLKNVRDRIAFLYETGYSVELFSRQGEGTRAVLSFPMECTQVT